MVSNAQKNIGMKKIAMTVAPSMPPITPVPSDCRLAADAPLAIASGMQPRMKASEVMMIGRSRSLAAPIAASYGDIPSFSRNSTANSKIRIAFLAASAISTVRPIWK